MATTANWQHALTGVMDIIDNLEELVWIDGYSDKLRGSCLIDERVDKGDIAIGLLVPSGTYSYVTGSGTNSTVPKFTALRVTEYSEG